MVWAIGLFGELKGLFPQREALGDLALLVADEGEVVQARGEPARVRGVVLERDLVGFFKALLRELESVFFTLEVMDAVVHHSQVVINDGEHAVVLHLVGLDDPLRLSERDLGLQQLVEVRLDACEAEHGLHRVQGLPTGELRLRQLHRLVAEGHRLFLHLQIARSTCHRGEIPRETRLHRHARHAIDLRETFHPRTTLGHPTRAHELVHEHRNDLDLDFTHRRAFLRGE